LVNGLDIDLLRHEIVRMNTESRFDFNGDSVASGGGILHLITTILVHHPLPFFCVVLGALPLAGMLHRKGRRGH